MTMLMTKRAAGFVRPSKMSDTSHRRDGKREEAGLLRQTQALLRQKEAMLEEMQHRVGNSLQLVASILMLKARSVSSEETRAHLIDAHRRVMAVAAVQEHLYRARRGERVEMDLYLSKLCERLADSLIGDTRPVTLRAFASGGVPSATAVSIGLLVAELVINALKHAFPDDRDDCQVTVGFEVNGSAWKLVVADNGAGKPIKPAVAAGSGLGSSLVRTLAHQLDAKIDIASSPRGRIVAVTHANLTSRSVQPLDAAQHARALV